MWPARCGQTWLTQPATALRKLTLCHRNTPYLGPCGTQFKPCYTYAQVYSRYRPVGLVCTVIIHQYASKGAGWGGEGDAVCTNANRGGRQVRREVRPAHSHSQTQAYLHACNNAVSGDQYCWRADTAINWRQQKSMHHLPAAACSEWPGQTATNASCSQGNPRQVGLQACFLGRRVNHTGRD